MARILVATFVLLTFGLVLVSCGDGDTEVGETAGEEAEEETDETSEEKTEEVVEEPGSGFTAGDTVWSTYYDPEYITALTWEQTKVVSVEGDRITVEFLGFLNEGEQETRHADWIYPYVESFSPDKALVGATVVVEPPGTSFVAYPGVIKEIAEGTYTVEYEVDGVPHTDEFTLEELH